MRYTIYIFQVRVRVFNAGVRVQVRFSTDLNKLNATQVQMQCGAESGAVNSVKIHTTAVSNARGTWNLSGE